MNDHNSQTGKSKHLTPEQFRKQGYQMIDFIADYMANIESYPVRSQVEPGEIYRSFPQSPPVEGEPFQDVLDDVREKVIPGLTHWQSPAFYAYFPSHASGPSILGDMLSSGFGIQGMLWVTSPACTEIETLVMDWMVEICGLPKHFHSSGSGGGVIQDSASSATLCAVVAARERSLRMSERIALADLTAYISDQTHSSAEKGLKIAGFRDEQIRKVNVGEGFAMDAAHLAQLVEQDMTDGRVPSFICATIGTTSSLTVDPVPEIAQIAADARIWLHVDAAYSGNAAVCPEYRYLLEGLDQVNSYCFNPHKWLLTNFDCDLFYVADKNDLVSALTFTPEYLRNKATEEGAVFDYSGWQVSLGRRFRSLKLWFVIRHYGAAGLGDHIRSQIEMAEKLTEWINDSEEFELFLPTALNVVCFRHCSGDGISEAIVERLNDSGKMFLTHTVLNGEYVIRFVPGAIRTEMRHVEEAWAQIQEVGQELEREFWLMSQPIPQPPTNY